MSKQSLTPDSKFSLTIKELIAAAVGFSSLIAMYFTLQADIAKAMELPEPEVQKIEFDYKDQLVRKTIEITQEDVSTIKSDIEEIKAQLNKMDERLYEISRK
tara:strand:- start:13216 stop:13521 length:306 start_codon:yes stop_codon:yes gene_type:complete